MDRQSIRTFFKIPAYLALTAISPAVSMACLPITLPLFCIGVVGSKRMMGYFDQNHDSDEEEESGLSYIFAASAIGTCLLAPVAPILESHALLAEAIDDFRKPRQPVGKAHTVWP